MGYRVSNAKKWCIYAPSSDNKSGSTASYDEVVKLCRDKFVKRNDRHGVDCDRNGHRYEGLTLMKLKVMSSRHIAIIHTGYNYRSWLEHRECE